MCISLSGKEVLHVCVVQAQLYFQLGDVCHKDCLHCPVSPLTAATLLSNLLYTAVNHNQTVHNQGTM
jgi:hypothetical protein